MPCVFTQTKDATPSRCVGLSPPHWTKSRIFVLRFALDESYIDYVESNPNAGVANNPDEYPTIDADLLVSISEEGAEENVSTGWHAIEFLLWGQDRNPDGPGLHQTGPKDPSPSIHLELYGGLEGSHNSPQRDLLRTLTGTLLPRTTFSTLYCGLAGLSLLAVASVTEGGDDFLAE